MSVMQLEKILQLVTPLSILDKSMFLLRSILLLFLICATATAQERKLEPISGKSLFKLRQTIQSVRKRGKLNPVARDSARAALLDTFVSGISLDDSPTDPWAKEHNHFSVPSYEVDSAIVDDELTLVRIWGTIRGPASQINSLTALPMVPIIMQLSPEGKCQISRGRVFLPEHAGGDFRFEVCFDRMERATQAMLIFVRPERTWAMYKDATTGIPKDQLLMIDISRKRLEALGQAGPPTSVAAGLAEP